MSAGRDSTLPDELVAMARKVIDANRAAGLRIAVAESCTGGLVSAALTEIPGSSDVFEAGWVTYANESKVSLLGVSQDVLETFADVSVALTGIAGPGGGTEKKPVGTVVFARARRGGDQEEIVADRRDFGDLGRGGVRLQAALCALELLMPEAEAPPAA
jgi:nicotinamide-nucleotide amidase